MDNENKKIPYWSKSRSDYESEIKKIMEQQRNSKLKRVHTPPQKWGEPVWQQVAHEMAWVIGLLEEDPTYPKHWKKVFNVLRSYENLCRESE